MLRRAMIMAQTQGGGIPYTKDGLVLWWDCEDFADGDATWVDRINGKIATETSYHAKNADGSVNFTNNGFTLPNLSDILDGNSQDFTIECALHTGATVGTNIFKYGIVRLGGWEGLCPVNAQSGNRRFLHPFKNRILSIGYSLYICCANGQQQEQTGSDYNAGSANGIGYAGGNINYKFNGKIWSLRIYNRVLSVDERNADALVDNTRFNLW